MKGKVYKVERHVSHIHQAERNRRCVFPNFNFLMVFKRTSSISVDQNKKIENYKINRFWFYMVSVHNCFLDYGQVKSNGCYNPYK